VFWDLEIIQLLKSGLQAAYGATVSVARTAIRWHKTSLAAILFGVSQLATAATQVAQAHPQVTQTITFYQDAVSPLVVKPGQGWYSFFGSQWRR